MFAPDHFEFDMQTAPGCNNTSLKPNPGPIEQVGWAQLVARSFAFRVRPSLVQL